MRTSDGADAGAGTAGQSSAAQWQHWLRMPYLADLPDAELHVFDPGHFARETHLTEIAPLIADFRDARSVRQ
ncbi:hypothetical protein AB0L63_01030 [Nocardia sp. NPDC051990]|uniref:hypothetical protein n=1 Tax=Nocardia sp. NPDC051990 TaxID=3155285 RepID=UPI0034430F45